MSALVFQYTAHALAYIHVLRGIKVGLIYKFIFHDHYTSSHHSLISLHLTLLSSTQATLNVYVFIDYIACFVCSAGTQASSVSIQVKSYLFTNGATAFISADGNNIVKDGIPPKQSSMQDSGMFLAMPFKSFSAPASKLQGMAARAPDKIDAISVSVYVKTATVYEDDCKFSVAYALYPNLNLQLQTDNPPRVFSNGNTAYCLLASFDSSTGVGSCDFTGDVCKSLFDFQSSVTSASFRLYVNQASKVVDSGDVMVSSIVKAKSITTSVTSPTVVRASAPRVPLRKSDGLFYLNVLVNTPDYEVNTWGLDLQYDSTLLQFDGVNVDSTLFGNPVVTVNNGVIGMSTAALATAQLTSLKGASVQLCDIRFTIAQSFVPGTTRMVVQQASIRYLTNMGGNNYRARQNITIDDVLATGNNGFAWATLQANSVPIGVQGYATPKFVVVGPSGTRYPTSVGAVIVNSGFSSGNTVLGASNSALQCMSASSIGNSVHRFDASGGCSAVNALAFPASKTEVGSGDIRAWGHLILTYSSGGVGLTNAVPISTFVASELVIVPDSSTLQLRCSLQNNGYTWTRVRRLARFHNGLVQSSTFDVSGTSYEYAVTVSPIGSVVSMVDNYFALGTSVGSAVISPVFSGSSGTMTLTSATITVANTLSSTFSSISLATMGTGQTIDWGTGVIVPSSSTNQIQLPRVMDSLRLAREGDDQYIIAVASASGMILPEISRAATISTVTSNKLAAYNVSLLVGNSGNKYWRGVVPVGAILAGVNEPTVTILATVPSGALCSVAQATVSVVMPKVVSVSMTISDGLSSTQPKLCIAGDIAVGIYRPSSTSSISVTVSFDDSSIMDATTDLRTSITFRSNPYSATLTRTSSGYTLTSPTAQPAHTVTLYASVFNGLKVSADVAVSIVKSSSIQPSVQRPDYSLVPSGLVTLHRMQCSTSVYEGVYVNAAVMMSDGQLVESQTAFAQAATYTSSNTAVLRLVSPNFFTGAAAGQATVQVSLGGVSGSVNVAVSNSPVFITQLVVPNIGVMLGQVGYSQTLVVNAVIDATYTISNIFSNMKGYTAANIVDLNEPSASSTKLISISSSDSGVLLPTIDGTLKIMNNSEVNIVIQVVRASTTCNGVQTPSAGQSINVPANLMPSSQADVDLGQVSSGVPIVELVVGSSVLVPIRMLASTFYLVGFEIVIFYDDRYVLPVPGSCKVSSSWTGQCTIGGEKGVIRMAAVNSLYASYSVADGVEIGTVQMQANPANMGKVVSPISGTVVSAIASGNSKIASYKDFVAGNLKVVCNTAASSLLMRRRLLQDQYVGQVILPASMLPFIPILADPIESDRAFAAAITTTDGTTTSARYGDVNGDNIFDVSDVVFAHEYYNGAASISCPTPCIARGALNGWQLQQLSPVGEDSTGARDIVYLLNVLLRNMHFVERGSLALVSNFTYISASVKLLDRNSLPVTSSARIMFAFSTTQNTIPFPGMTYDSVRKMAVSYAQPCMSQSQGCVAGTFTTATTPSSTPRWLNESNVGVVFAVETFDAAGQSSPARRFPFYSVTVGLYADYYSVVKPYTSIAFQSTASYLVATTPSPTSAPSSTPRASTPSPTSAPSSTPRASTPAPTSSPSPSSTTPSPTPSSTPPATSSTPAPTPATGTLGSTVSSSLSSTMIAIIVSCAVGGVIIFSVCVFCVILCIRRRERHYVEINKQQGQGSAGDAPTRSIFKLTLPVSEPLLKKEGNYDNIYSLLSSEPNSRKTN